MTRIKQFDSLATLIKGNLSDDNPVKPNEKVNGSTALKKVLEQEIIKTKIGDKVTLSRSAMEKVEYIDYDGKKKNIKAKGLLATCIQHEIDHLNGILFIDYLSKLKKDMIIKKLIKQKKEINKIVL